MDAYLDRVHQEDRVIIKNVVAAIEAMKKGKLFTSWTYDVGSGCYIVTAHITEADCEFSSRELEMLHDVNPLRVMCVSIQRMAGKNSLRVKVSDRDQPLMLTDTQVVHVRKKSRWLL
jgi:hypothetical protein